MNLDRAGIQEIYNLFARMTAEQKFRNQKIVDALILCKYLVDQFGDPIEIQKRAVEFRLFWSEVANNEMRSKLLDWTLRHDAYRELEDTAMVFNHVMLQDVKDTFNAVSPKDVWPLTKEERRKVFSFLQVMKNADEVIVNKKRPYGTEGGYVETSAVNKLTTILDGFKTRILISGTPPPRLLDLRRVTLDNPESFEKTLFILFNQPRKIKALLSWLSDRFNVLGVTNSIRNAKLHKKNYGGHVSNEFSTVKKLKDELKREKSKDHLIWLYYGSTLYKAVNVEEIDVVVVFDWIGRYSPDVEIDRELRDLHSLNDLSQSIGRGIRPRNGKWRKRDCHFLQYSPARIERGIRTSFPAKSEKAGIGDGRYDQSGPEVG